MRRHSHIFFMFIASMLPLAGGFVLLQPSAGHADGKQYSSSLFCSSSQDSFDMAELSRRIEGLQSAEKILGLTTASTSKRDESEEQDNEPSIINLPVIAMDSLLPNQRMKGRTTDRTFGRLLARTGLGGLFVMVSINNQQRKLRRNGVICRLELVDAPSHGNAMNGRAVTAVDFQLVGLRRCRVVGPPSDMSARIGRWRRCYDPNGESSHLGFGTERFVDVDEEVASTASQDNMETTANPTELRVKDWTSLPVDIDIQDCDNDEPEVIEKAESIIPLLDQWQALASNVTTYDNVDVVAASRVIKGEPGLRVDPAALLRKVLKDLGERPPPTSPAAFALWGAALINPLPALGVSPEIRGRLLEAPTAKSKLEILEWGVKRSIANLQGNAPL